MSCDPATTVTQQDVTNLKADILTISEVVESNDLTTVTKLGKVIATLTGRLAQLGYIPPVNYAGGIAFLISDNVKTIDQNGIIYAPLPSALPFTTSGTWTADDEDKFFVIQGLTLYGGLVLIPKTSVASMSSDASLQIGNLVMTEGYYAPGDAGTAFYTIVAAATGTHDGGSYIDLSASGLQAKALFSLANFSVAQFGAVGNGVADDTAPIQRALDILAISGGGTLTFPLVAGAKYKCNIVLQSNINLEGAARHIELTPATNSPVVTLRPDVDVSRVSFKLITINGLATKGSFGAQDGIRSAPDAGITHSTISMVDCLITDCGAAGIALIGGATTGSDKLIRLPHLVRTVITGCVKPGLHVVGNVELLSADTCEISNNGSESVDAESNITIDSDGAGFPSEINFTNCGIDTTSYVAGGNSVACLGVLGVAFIRCFFSELHTGVLIDSGANGNVVFRDNRWERTSGAITALVEVVDVNGFTWINNNVAAATTGPVGINLAGVVGDMLSLSIDHNNSWGGLTIPMDDYPAAVLSGTDVSLPRSHGLIPITLSADGASNLDNIFDEKGGTAQLVHGDMIVLHSISNARDITLKDSTGNLRLAGAADMALGDVRNTVTLMWSTVQAGYWVEVSRSVNV